MVNKKQAFIDALDEFTKAYLEAALWSSTDGSTAQGGEPLDSNYRFEHICWASLRKMVHDCVVFQKENRTDIGDRLAQAGHDLWLTRNHHGAGFWETPDWPKEAGERLTKAAHALGEVSLWAHRGRIYQE